MIVAAEVERFRGLSRLEVDGLSRVNVIIGKNNCGKTALMEALEAIDDVDDAAWVILSQQEGRDRGMQRGEEGRDRSMQGEEMERFWLPLFWNQDAERGFRIRARDANGSQPEVEFRKLKAASTVVTSVPKRSHKRRARWAIEVLITTDEGKRREEITSTDKGGVRLPKMKSESSGGSWIGPAASADEGEIQMFSELKKAGRDAELLEVLREVDDRVKSLEILAPTGAAAEVFVRLDPRVPLLPLSMMGDGFQRCFEIGVDAIANESPTLFIDEIENGLHHSVLEPIWRWIAAISAKRNMQVFATTHSEECIQAACRAFTAANDDGLRVIRLDRRDDGTFATIYDRSLVEAATEMGVEIRG